MKSYKKYSLFILLGFGIVYAAISLVNHYLFRTFALDLGAYTNALYDYAHFQWNDSRAFKAEAENLLADHFDLYLILFSPLSWIFKSYTLLIIQIVFLLLGGWGIYQYFSLDHKTEKLARWAMIWYLSFFGVFSALAFDYHSNVVAASLLPWFFYFLRKKQNLSTVLIFISIIISKENMSLWMAFVSMGLIWEYRKIKSARNLLIVLSLFSFVFFIAVIGWIMPAFSNSGSYPHFHYSVLGNSASEAIINLLKHPFENIKVLFINHTPNPLGDQVKMEFFIYLWITGFYVLLKKPHYILMLVPVFFQKMFHDNYIFWSTTGQYSIEFVPIMSIGIFLVIADLKHHYLKKLLVIGVLLGNIAISIRVMDNPIISNDKVRIRFYQKTHYNREFDVGKLHSKLNEIPQDAIVSAQSPLMPHISWRESVYQFPNIDNAEFIAISSHEVAYPLTLEQYHQKVDLIKSDTSWKIWYKQEGILIFRKANDQ